jgi:hypothetical protein
MRRVCNRIPTYCAWLHRAGASLSALTLPQRSYSYALVAFDCAASPARDSLRLEYGGYSVADS